MAGILVVAGAFAFRQYLERIVTPGYGSNTAEERAARRLVTANREGRIMLAGQSREVLPSDTRSIEIEALPGGVLEHALGVDRILFGPGEGYAEATWELRTATGEVLSRQERRLSLSKATSVGWHHLEVVLPENLSGPLELVLERKFIEMKERPAVPGADATDLLYWARPIVRPRKLPGRPNIVLISVDTLRADHLSFMGYGRETSPRIDRLTHDGVAFFSCYSQSPWTTPSHFSILTGMAPHRHGADFPYQRLVKGWDRQRDTLADLVRRAGYSTRAFTGGGMVKARYGFDDGFDAYSESLADDVEAMVEKARRWLRRHADRTFFLFLHTWEAHDPYEDGHFVDLEEIPESEEWARMVARYDGDIRRADHHLGRLFVELEELGLWESTLVVLTSDHGEELDQRLDQPGWKPWDHGHSLYDELLHVPLVFGGGVPSMSGLRIDDQVRSIDIAPTLLDYADLPIPPEIQGRSLRPLIQGRADEPRPALAEATTFGTERIAIRTPQYKLIRRLSRGQLDDPENPGFPWTPKEELYDLRRDQGERRNLAEEESALVRQLDELLESLREPREDGRTPESLAEDEELRRQLEALGYVN